MWRLTCRIYCATSSLPLFWYRSWAESSPGTCSAEVCVYLFIWFAVYGRRDRCSASGQHEVDYWISDGIYGSLNGIIYDHTVPQPLPLHMDTTDKERRVLPTTLFGPTCDGADVVLKNYMLPELDMGDWVVFPNMGAYSIAGSCTFNGFQVSNPPIFYIYTDQP